MSDRFSVVIATLGRPLILAEALRAAVAADPPPFEVVVIDGDDAESSRSVTEAAAAGTPVPVRYHRAERGLTRQRNAGLEVASGDVVVFVDDDARVPPDAFSRLAEAYAEPSVVGATGRVIEPASNRVGGKESSIRRLLPGGGREGDFTRFGYPRRLVHPDVGRDVEFMAGCFMTARLDAARRVGFDEHLPGYALAEDEDFSYRLSRLGPIRYLPDLVVAHDNAGFGGRDRRRFGRQVVVNRHYLFRKNFAPTPLARIQFALLIGVLFVHRLLNRDLAGVRGIIDGVIEVLTPGSGAGAADPAAKSPRVVFVSSHAQRGGSEHYLLGVLERLGPEWIDRIIALEDGPLVGDLGERGLTVDVVRTSGRRMDAVLSAARLRRLLGRRPAVIHANGIKAALVSVLATIGSRRHAVIWVKHDFSWSGAVGRWVARRCARVVGVSRAVLQPLAGAGESVVVPTGLAPIDVDADGGRQVLRTLTGGDGPFVLLVGRLDAAKGHEDVLACAPAVLAAVPEARFVFVGGAEPTQPDFGARLQAAARGLPVTITGHRDDAVALMAGADVVVVASHAVDGAGMGQEGFGLVGLEAMAAGTPVVAYAAGAVPEVLGSCGLLVPPRDPKALGEALVSVLTDRRLAGQLVRCGLERAGEFSVDRQIAGLQAVYREVNDEVRGA